MNAKNYPVGTVISVSKAIVGRHKGLVTRPGYVAHAFPGRGACETTIAEFAKGKEITAERIVANPFRAARRAHDLIQRGFLYSLLFSNCEHFISLCEEKEAESPQLQAAIVAVAVLAFISRM